MRGVERQITTIVSLCHLSGMETTGILLGNKPRPMVASADATDYTQGPSQPLCLDNCIACANTVDLGVEGSGCLRLTFPQALSC